MKLRPLMFAGITTGFSTFALSALAQQSGDGGYGYHPHMWGHGSWGGGTWVNGWAHGPLMVLFTIIVLVLVVMAISRLTGCHRHRCGRSNPGNSNALNILEERFAKGEIDKAEFEEGRTALKS